MESKITSAVSSPSSMHPMLWIAAISVTLLSFAGIASFTGLLPIKSESQMAASGGSAVPATLPVYAPPEPAATKPEMPAAAVVPQAPTAVAPAVASPAALPKPVRKKAVVHHAQRPETIPMAPVSAGGVPPDYAPPPPVAAAQHCSNCGVVSDIRPITREGQGSGLGAIAGGVLGGVLGNNVGNGNGRTLATIAGAVGGGFLGNKVEKSQRESVVYQISVRMDDGTTQMIEASSTPPWHAGDHVRLVNGAIVSR